MNGEQVYNLALALIDEVTESGEFSPDNPDYYKKKSVSFLTMLQAELVPTSTVLTSLNDSLSVSDRVALSVLPYGLAAHLMMGENPSLASFFNARYDELKRKQSTASESITDVYDMFGSMQ